MGALVETKTSSKGKQKVEIDINELILRLRSIESSGNIEVTQLAIQSMLEEIFDALDSEKK